MIRDVTVPREVTGSRDVTGFGDVTEPRYVVRLPKSLGLEMSL